MKISTLKAEVTVPAHIKTFSLLLAIFDKMYGGERETTIRRLAHYYGVPL